MCINIPINDKETKKQPSSLFEHTFKLFHILPVASLIHQATQSCNNHDFISVFIYQ